MVKEKIEQEGPDQEDEKMETNSSETMIKVCSCGLHNLLCLKHTTVITHESFILFTHVHALPLSMYNVSVHDSAPFLCV